MMAHTTTTTNDSKNFEDKHNNNGDGSESDHPVPQEEESINSHTSSSLHNPNKSVTSSSPSVKSGRSVASSTKRLLELKARLADHRKKLSQSRSNPNTNTVEDHYTSPEDFRNKDASSKNPIDPPVENDSSLPASDLELRESPTTTLHHHPREGRLASFLAKTRSTSNQFPNHEDSMVVVDNDEMKSVQSSITTLSDRRSKRMKQKYLAMVQEDKLNDKHKHHNSSNNNNNNDLDDDNSKQLPNLQLHDNNTGMNRNITDEISPTTTTNTTTHPKDETAENEKKNRLIKKNSTFGGESTLASSGISFADTYEEIEEEEETQQQQQQQNLSSIDEDILLGVLTKAVNEAIQASTSTLSSANLEQINEQHSLCRLENKLENKDDSYPDLEHGVGKNQWDHNQQCKMYSAEESESTLPTSNTVQRKNVTTNQTATIDYDGRRSSTSNIDDAQDPNSRTKKRKKKCGFTTCTLVLLLLYALGISGFAAYLFEDYFEKQNLNKDYLELEKQLNDATNTLKQLVNQNITVTTEANELKKENALLQTTVTQLENETYSLKLEVSSLTQYINSTGPSCPP